MYVLIIVIPHYPLLCLPHCCWSFSFLPLYFSVCVRVYAHACVPHMSLNRFGYRSMCKELFTDNSSVSTQLKKMSFPSNHYRPIDPQREQGFMGLSQLLKEHRKAVLCRLSQLLRVWSATVMSCQEDSILLCYTPYSRSCILPTPFLDVSSALEEVIKTSFLWPSIQL